MWRRYRFTAAFLKQLLIGPWNTNCPSSPHKLLNAYVYAVVDYALSDGCEDFSKTEPDVAELNIHAFAWDRLSQGTSSLDPTIYI
jgi:hypothetical protein